MRDPHRNKAKRLRRKRRAVLAVIMIASSPVMADGLANNSSRIPLPLKPLADASQVHANPFCQPSPSRAPAREVQLASGTKSSAIRLKPIGAAIGLHSIDATHGTKDNSPAMTIEKVGPSEVRNNPLVESTHHTNLDLVEAEVDDRTIAAPGRANSISVTPIATPPKTGSSIVLVPPAPTQPPLVEHDILPLVPAVPVAAPATVPHAVAPPAVTPQTRVPAAVAVEPAPQENNPSAAPVEEVAAAIVEEQDEPVYFSLSDRFDEEKPPQASAAAEVQSQAAPAEAAPPEPAPPEPAPPETVTADNTPEPELVASGDAVAAGPTAASDESPSDDESSLADQERSLPEPVVIAADGSVQLGVAEPIELDDEASDAALESIESVIGTEGEPPIAIYRSEPALVQLAETAEATLHTKRYRPPVAVKPVPIAFERSSEELKPSIESTVKSVQAPNLDGFEVGPNSKLTPLYMSRAQVRSLTLGGEIRGVKVADKEICQAFAAGPNQLKLIGTGNGVTRLVVWADADDVDAPTRMRTFEIHVKEAVSTTGDAIGNKAELLNQTIRKAFPNSNVRVRPDRGQLIVMGRCDSEASAKQIIRMVRKTCLVPVQDNLLVR